MGADSKKHPIRHTTIIGVGGIGASVIDGLARLVDIAPPEFITVSEDTDWGLVGADFRQAIDTLIASDQRLQPPLPFEEEELVEAK